MSNGESGDERIAEEMEALLAARADGSAVPAEGSRAAELAQPTTDGGPGEDPLGKSATSGQGRDEDAGEYMDTSLDAGEFLPRGEGTAEAVTE